MSPSAAAPPKPLTLSIIRSATRAVDEDALLATRVLRLDWLGLTSLGDSLDLFDGLRELYLQHNRLSDISGLELLQNLELLTLGGNGLREVSLNGAPTALVSASTLACLAVGRPFGTPRAACA